VPHISDTGIVPPHLDKINAARGSSSAQVIMVDDDASSSNDIRSGPPSGTPACFGLQDLAYRAEKKAANAALWEKYVTEFSGKYPTIVAFAQENQFPPHTKPQLTKPYPKGFSQPENLVKQDFLRAHAVSLPDMARERVMKDLCAYTRNPRLVCTAMAQANELVNFHEEDGSYMICALLLLAIRKKATMAVATGAVTSAEAASGVPSARDAATGGAQYRRQRLELQQVCCQQLPIPYAMFAPSRSPYHDHLQDYKIRNEENMVRVQTNLCCARHLITIRCVRIPHIRRLERIDLLASTTIPLESRTKQAVLDVLEEVLVSFHWSPAAISM
jgi:hypothetical protein